MSNYLPKYLVYYKKIIYSFYYNYPFSRYLTMKLPLIFSLFLATMVAKIFIVQTDDQNAEKKRHEMEGEKVYIPRKVLLRTFTDM